MSKNATARCDTAKCSNCDNPTNKPLSERTRCQCGSVCWYVGERMKPLWRAVTEPAILAMSSEDFVHIRSAFERTYSDRRLSDN